MASVGKSYVKDIWQRFSYLGAWLPNTNLRLGDIGVQNDAEFHRVKSLKDLGIAFEVRAGKDRVDFSYTSESGVALKTKAHGEVAAGTTLPQVKAGIAIEFAAEGAFVFQATGCTIDEIEDKAAVGRAAVALFQQDLWQADWAVVDTLVTAQSATILVSESQSAGLELTANTPVTIGDLAKADAGLAVHAQRGVVFQVLAARGLAPLFRASKVKQSFLSKWFGGGGGITFGGPAPGSVVRASSRALESPLEPLGPST